MKSFTDYVADGRQVLDEYLLLAVVPVVSALLAFDDIQRVASFRGFHVGISLPFPTPIVDVWTFVQLPQGPGVGNIPLAIVLAVVNAVMAAGYLSVVRDALAEEPTSFGAGVTRYAPSLLGYQLLVTAVVLVFGAFAVAIGPLLLLAIPAFVALTYLFFSTPYLVVADDVDLLSALRRSYRYAIAGGFYFAFAVRFLVLGMGISVVATLFVVNLGLVGVAVGTFVVAPVGVVLSGATMSFVLDLVDGGAAETSRNTEYPHDRSRQ